MVRRHHDRQHGVAPERGVIGHEDDRITVGRDLHGARHDTLGVEPSPARPFAQHHGAGLGPEAHADPVGLGLRHEHRLGQPRQGRGGELFGVRAGDHTQLDHHRRRRVDVGGSARHHMIPERRRPLAGVQHVARGQRTGAQSGQLVGPGRCRTTPARGGRRPPPGSCGSRRAGARSPAPGRRRGAAAVRPAPACRRPAPPASAPTTATWQEPRQRNRVPPPVSSSAPDPVPLPVNRLASSNDTGSAGPAAGHTRRRHVPAPAVLHHGAQPRRHHLEHRPGLGRQGPRRCSHRRRLDGIAPSGHRELDPVPRRQHGVRERAPR